MDEKTGKIVSSSASTDCDIATNIDDEDKVMNQKIIKLQSSSLPDLTVQNSSPSSTGTISSNSNNQTQLPETGHGTHVILAVEHQDDESMNHIGEAIDHSMMKKKIKLNINLASNASSLSTSSNNLEYGNLPITTPDTI